MNVLEAIHARTSIRKYQDKAVPREVVLELFKAGMAAPTAKNAQPWHFMAITEKDTLAAIAAHLPFGKMLPTAPLGIMVAGDVEIMEQATPGYPEYWVVDCSAACENIALAAVELGLGTVWLGVHPIPERVRGLKETLKLPDNILPLCMLSIGYPAAEGKPKDKFKEDRIHWEKW
jgi:Nitroreductase